MKKKSPVCFKEEEKTLLMTLNERQRRLFIACKAVGDDGFAIEHLCKFLKVSTKTVCKGIRELREKQIQEKAEFADLEAARRTK